MVMDAASMLGISLDTDQADCVVDRLGAEAARETVANDPGPELATPIVNCVGADQIGFIALQPLAPAASEDSIRCAAARLDNEFVTALVARAFDPDQMMPQGLELEVTSALAMCLTPGEVLTS